MCTDWVTFGVVEVGPDGTASLEATREALLAEKKNHRRALVQQIALFSSNARAPHFVLPQLGKSSVVDDLDAAAATALPTDTGDTDLPNLCTDFVLAWGTETLCSNNSGCVEFVMANGLGSAKLTNADLLWMERVADVPPGTIFKAFSSREALGPSEVAWDPVTRYNALAKSLKTARGAKSVEHTENLRKSDPLINPSAWIDWSSLYASIKTTRSYRFHQAALIKRAMRAHALETRGTNGRETVDAFARGERMSSDSVMVMDPIGELLDEESPEEEEPTDLLSPVAIETRHIHGVPIGKGASAVPKKAAQKRPLVFDDEPTGRAYFRERAVPSVC